MSFDSNNPGRFPRRPGTKFIAKLPPGLPVELEQRRGRIVVKRDGKTVMIVAAIKEPKDVSIS